MDVNSAGFSIDENVITSTECDALIEALKPIAARRAGARHLMREPAVARIANDERLLRIARRELESDPVPFRATLFAKTGKANWLVVWHQDTALPLEAKVDSPDWGPWSTKEGILYAHAPAWALCRVVALRVHLDDSSWDNGPLRVIPGSHTDGVLSDEAVFALARRCGGGGRDCVVARGGVLAMRPLLIHCSSRSTSTAPRRVLHLEYADALELGKGIRLAIA